MEAGIPSAVCQDEDGDDWLRMQITHHRLPKSWSPAVPLITQHPQVPQTLRPAPNYARQFLLQTAELLSRPVRPPRYIPLNKWGDVSVLGDGAVRILTDRTCGSLSERAALGDETLTSVAVAHSKVPERATWRPRGRPKSAPRHLLAASLTFCLSYMNVSSPRHPSLHTPISLLPFFFRQWEKWHLLMAILCAWPPRKPELFLSPPWRLPINSSNHQSAKYFQFRAHQLEMKWQGVIYRTLSALRVYQGVDRM